MSHLLPERKTNILKLIFTQLVVHIQFCYKTVLSFKEQCCTALYTLYTLYSTVHTLHTVQHCTALYTLYTLYSTVQHCTHCTALYSTVQHCTALYSTEQHCTALYTLYSTVHTVQHCKHCTALYTLYSTLQHCTQCTALYSTVQHCRRVLYWSTHIKQTYMSGFCGFLRVVIDDSAPLVIDDAVSLGI